VVGILALLVFELWDLAQGKTKSAKICGWIQACVQRFCV
tara:strand:+ start:3721 stop:3837 length:117 start_codon:yes stop_codon:yes gene_type:complete